MDDLTGRQKRRLRAAGQRLPTAVRIGKAGLTDAVLEQIRQALRRRELVKVHMPPPARKGQRKAEALDLASQVGAALAALAGHAALLYRPNPDLPAEQRLAWPD